MDIKKYIKKIVLVGVSKIQSGTVKWYHIYFDITDIVNPRGIFITETCFNDTYTYDIKPFGFYPSSNNNFIFDSGMANNTEKLERKMNMFKNLSNQDMYLILNKENDE